MANNCIQISDPRGSTEHLELVKYTPEQQPLNMSSHFKLPYSDLDHHS